MFVLGIILINLDLQNHKKGFSLTKQRQQSIDGNF